MEVRQIRYFLAVAEYGSIAAAARMLHIAQPALSRQIVAIEAEMACRLFERLPRGMALTRAGQELVQRATEILKQTLALKDQVQLAAQGRVGHLRIGILPGFSWLPVLAGTLAQLAQESVGVTILLEPSLSSEQLKALKEGRLDAAIAAWRSPLDPSLQGRVIYRDHMAIAMPKSLAQARKRQLRLADLASSKFIMFPRDRSPVNHDVLMQAFAQAGISPSSSPMATDLATLMGLVGAGLGCTIVPLSYGRHCAADVVVRQVPDLDIRFDLELIWRAASVDSLLNYFLALSQATVC